MAANDTCLENYLARHSSDAEAVIDSFYNLRVIMTNWFQIHPEECQLLRQLGGASLFPEHYLICDIETTGFSFDNDLITQVGWGTVVNRQLTDTVGLVIDWTQSPGIDQGWLREQLCYLQRTFQQQGRVYAVTYDKMREIGEPPEVVFDALRNLINEYSAHNEWVAGHNLRKFDRRMIDANMDYVLPHQPIAWPDCYIDTGLFEKAAQIQLLPKTGETMHTWYDRVDRAFANGVKWNLDRHCAIKYKLAERYNLNMADAHDAGFDCRLVYYLLETFREMASV